MKKNLMKEKLNKGDIALGVIIQEPATEISEILGLLGFDWLFIDCEHSPMSIESVAQLIMAAEIRELLLLFVFRKMSRKLFSDIWMSELQELSCQTWLP